MKKISSLSAALVLICLTAFSQQNDFPAAWQGNWKGELSWFKTGNRDPQKVNMELRIHKTDTAWTWQLIYGSAKEDNRPYILLPRDTSGVHWVIDELNGIVLDQYLVGNQFSGAFTVMGATIVNNYHMENGKLVVEFFSYPAKPVATTGNGTDDSPKVDSYRIASYQKAILERTN
ncbi:MAG: hypothetical protein IPP73_12045 [Chitinophagaceae bacterium]|nr:hypothetical protein [Chitinophagaceae bacterium]